MVRSWSSGRFEQHRAAQAAADADRGEPTPAAGTLQHTQRVQHDPGPGCADRMSQCDRSPVDVELCFVKSTERMVQAKLVVAITFSGPCPHAGDHLRGKRL